MIRHFLDKEWLKTVTEEPGIYRMQDASGTVIYVGKAKNLKNRLSNYFQANSAKKNNQKTNALISLVSKIEVTVTRTENEALILEANLIKSLQPRYNILLKDDKTYPYIYLSTKDDFPRLSIYRGNKKLLGDYFGPYPHAKNVRENLNFLQKFFPIRQCEDAFFKNRSRPCLQYEIKRCTAPCVNYITKKDYQQDVDNAIMFLKGKNKELMLTLIKKMQEKSDQQEYELATKYRDQITKLRFLQEQQHIVSGEENIDFIGYAIKEEVSCICILFVRHGRCLGSQSYFFKKNSDPIKQDNPTKFLSAFLSQYYLSKKHVDEIPEIIVLSHVFEEKQWLQNSLQEVTQTKISFLNKAKKNTHIEWLKMTLLNAKIALESHLKTKNNIHTRFNLLNQFLQAQKNFTPEQLIKRIECYDISHTSGEKTVGSCVVFTEEGASKSNYRRYNIENIIPGDDYAAMEQVLQRRFSHLAKEKIHPDLILIDGGKGQLKKVKEVLADYLLNIIIIGVAKGAGRKAGHETLFLSTENGSIILELEEESPVRLLIQQIRDEAHRFAITAHKARRSISYQKSALENIKGIGPKKRRALLSFFGGNHALQKASVEELTKVEGISAALAQEIYFSFHEHGC